jgi:hypothetical protein
MAPASTSSSDWVFALTSTHGQTIERLECNFCRSQDEEQDATENSTTSNHSGAAAATATGPPETASLLSTTKGSSWTLQSPYWSLTSSILMQITYRPAWQGIPGYTRLPLARDCARRALFQCGSSSSSARPVEFSLLTFTTEDVVRMERLDDLLIRGIEGSCTALRLCLANKSMGGGSSLDMPAKLHAELTKQCRLPEHLTHNWDRLREESADTLGTSDYTDGPTITFAMPSQQSSDQSVPPLLWKVQMPPDPNVSLETITVLQGSLDASRGNAPTHLYVNGYQSWSFSGSIVKGSPQPQSALPDLYSGAFNQGGSPPPVAATEVHGDRNGVTTHSPGIPKSASPYQSDFFACITSDGHVPSTNETDLRRFPYRALDEGGGPALVMGWLSQHRQYGVVQTTKDLTSGIAMHVSFDNTLLKRGAETDWAYAELVPPHGYDEEPMVHYLHAVASHNVARPLQNGPILTGWCSWYHYYENITAANLRDNFHKLQGMNKKVPTNVAIVDDGYMTAWGDWHCLKPGKFPHGLKGVSDDIIACGMRPGLWMAPFGADKHSKLAKQHPDWIIRNDVGRIANSSNCGKFFYGLDATNPHVREYVHSCVRRAVRDWGFTVLKIDFLYAACLDGNGKYDLSISRAEAMHLALQTIRAAAGPDVYLIGCGCPIGPGIGYVDANRISADTGPTWYPAFPLPYWDNGTLPSVRAMVRNSISRAPVGHRWWHNDPDCLLLGNTTKLTDLEVASAASVVAMTCGMLLLSDDLTKVPLVRMRIASKIYPMTGASAVVLDLHSTNDGLPSLLRLWCTDRYQPIIRPEDLPVSQLTDHNHEATLLARHASFTGMANHVPSDRKRSCIHVAVGMGTWTMVSISNWTDKPAVVRVPHSCLLPPSPKGWREDLSQPAGPGPIYKHGLHVFSFWSGEYTWMPDPRTEEGQRFDLRKLMQVHETEIFHIKPVNPSMPEYLGSAIHFSCGYEVSSVEKTADQMAIQLRKTFYRLGHVYLYIPRPKVDEIDLLVGGKTATFEAFGNTPDAENPQRLIGRVIRFNVIVRGDGSPNDGEIVVKF